MRMRQHTSAYVSIRLYFSIRLRRQLEAHAEAGLALTWRANVLEDELLARTGKRVLITGVRRSSVYHSVYSLYRHQNADTDT